MISGSASCDVRRMRSSTVRWASSQWLRTNRTITASATPASISRITSTILTLGEWVVLG